MLKPILRRALVLVLCFFLLSTNTPARADSLQRAADALVIGVVAAAAAIVVVVVILVHHRSTSVKGCVASGSSGLELRNDGDQLTYQLVGLTADVKPGDVVKVKGKKKSGKGGAAPKFEVRQFGQDFGACPVPK